MGKNHNLSSHDDRLDPARVEEKIFEKRFREIAAQFDKGIPAASERV